MAIVRVNIMAMKYPGQQTQFLTKYKMTKKPKLTLKKLTNQEKIFKNDYLIHLSPYQAAITAKYSKTVAKTRAYQWVSNSELKPHLFKAIQKALAKRAAKMEVTQEGVLKDIKDIGDKALEAKKYGDALKSRELLGKHLKLFTDKVELGFDGTALMAVLAVLPPEYAEQVKKALSMYKS